MISLLSKSVDQIRLEDIQALIDECVPEGEHIEYKEKLPAKRGACDPWMNEGEKIGDHAKKCILEEMVAFANAFGGVLVLGIEESGKKPPVAEKISPIPKCADRAERLKLMFRDLVEPELPRIDVLPLSVENADNNGGVIVLRVGRSRLAPHRVKKGLECPIRRSDRCEKMTMREIQDMTLNLSRGLERVNKEFFARADLFEQKFQHLVSPNAWGVRFTAVPILDEIRFDSVFENNRIVGRVEPCWREVAMSQTDALAPVPINMDIPGFKPAGWCPRLRSTKAESRFNNEQDDTYQEIHCDGLLEFGLTSRFGNPCNRNQRKSYLVPERLLYLFSHLCVWADQVRKEADVPSIEYAIEFELRVLHKVRIMYADSEYSRGNRFTKVFPRYRLGSPENISSLLGLYYRDFLNHIGFDIDLNTVKFDIR